MPTQDISKIKNTLERRAALIVDMLNDKAERIVDVLDEPAPGTEEPDPATIRAMWSFTPYGDRAPEVFWGLHDLALQKMEAEMAAQPIEDPAERLKAIRQIHQKAEMAALTKVYPHRAELILLGLTTPARSVELAQRARRLVDQDDKRQSTPEMPDQQETY